MIIYSDKNVYEAAKERIRRLFDMDFSPSSEYESTEEDETVTQKEEVSKEEVEAFKEKERKIEDGMTQEATEYIEMKCPHCGEIIRMRK